MSGASEESANESAPAEQVSEQPEADAAEQVSEQPEADAPEQLDTGVRVVTGPTIVE